MLEQKEKEKIIQQYRTHETDTGSPEIQVGLLSEEIQQLLSHLKKHPKDVHSKRGLLKMVSSRRSLLKYLKQESESRYNTLVKRVGLKQ